MRFFKLSLLGGVVLAVMSGTALAHGTMSHPKARILHCYAGSQSEGCKAFQAQGGSVYDWREVWQKPGGEATFPTTPGDRLCDGGTKASHRGLNALAQWPVTTLKPDANGKVTLKWNHTVAHRTKSIQFFVTKMPYDSTKPLQFSDLEKFCEYRDFTPAIAGHQTLQQEYSCTLPPGKNGRHLIVSVWNTNHVGDGVTQGESYRACGDVNIEGNTSVTMPSDLGALYGIGQPVAGDTLVWRLADPKRNGEYLEQLRVPVDQNGAQGERWTKVLGDAVNGSSQRVRIGQLSADGKTVTSVEGLDKSHVYTIDGNKYHFAVSKEAAEVTPPPVPEVIAPQSKITGPYSATAGQSVTLSGTGSTGSDLKFSWTVPAGVNAAVKNQPTLSFVAPTLTKDQQYSFKLTTTNAKGSSDANHVVTVKGKPDTGTGGDNGNGGDTGTSVPAYKPGTIYKELERVSNRGKIYECKAWPYTNWCGQSPFHYEPGKGMYWNQAWTLVK